MDLINIQEKKFPEEFSNLGKSIKDRKLRDFDKHIKNIIFESGDLEYMGNKINVENYEMTVKYINEDLYFFRFFKITGKNEISGFLLYLGIVSAFDEDLVYEVYKILRTEYSIEDISGYIIKNKHSLLLDPNFYLDYIGDLEKDYQPSFNKEDYLKNSGLQEKIEVYSKKPEWVSILPTETIISLQETGVLKKLILKDDEVKLVEKFIEKTFDFDKKKIDLFRLYGPSNVLTYGEDYEEIEDDPNSKCQDCRMLRCTCLQEDEADTENWFGKCGICENTIRDISWAVRAPHKNGGWYGCYCSFDCAQHDVDEDNLDNFNRMKSQILTFGIMDRSLY